MRNQQIIYKMVFCCFLLSTFTLSQEMPSKGDTLFHSGRFNQAKEFFEQILINNPDDARANYFIGRIYLISGEYDEAEDYLEKSVEIDQRNIDYRLGLATFYREKARRASFLSAATWAGKWKKELEMAYEIEPKNIEARKQLINYLLNAPWIGGGDKDRGKMLAEETIEINEYQGRLLLAYAYNRMDKGEMAIAEYKKVLNLDPKSGSAYNSLGYLYLKKKDYESAESNFKKYIEVAHADPNAYDSMGDYYSERGMLNEAIAQYQKVLELDSKYSVSRFKLAQAYEEQDIINDAIHHYERLLELTPSHIRVDDAKERLEDLKK